MLESTYRRVQIARIGQLAVVGGMAAWWAVTVCTPGIACAAELAEVRQLYLAGNYDACAQAAAARLAQGYSGEDWVLLKIESDLQRGRYAQALATLDAGLKEFPFSVRLRWTGYRVLLFNQQPDRARKTLEEIAELATQGAYRYSDAANRVTLGRSFLQRGADARRVLETFYDPAKKDQPDQVDPYLAAGDLALSKGDYALAAEEFTQALKRAPEHPDVFFGLVRAYTPSDDKRTNENLQNALQRNPHHVPSLLFVIDRHVDAERYDDARTVLEQVLAINPLCPEAWAIRAVLAHLDNDADAERQARDRALSTWTTNPHVDHLIGRKLSSKYRFLEGAQYQRQALECDASFVPAQLQLSQDLLRTGHEAEGWQRAELVFEVDEYNVVAHNLVQLQANMARFRTLENEDFLVRMDAHEAEIYGDRVLDLLSRAKQTLCTKYDLQIDEPVIVEIFPQQQDFAIRTFGLPGGAGFLGVCFGRVITANSPASQGSTPSNWESVLWHEFCHVVTLQKTRNRMPRWLSEGISVYEEGQANRAWGHRPDPTYREMILGDALTPVSQLSGAFLNPRTPLHLQFAYLESALVVEYLVEKYGPQVLNQMLTDLGAGLPIQDVLQRYCGSSTALDQEFAQYARAQAEQWAPDATWETLDLPNDASVTDLADFVALHPRHFLALRQYARALIDLRRWEEARLPLEQMRELWPDYVGTDNAYQQLADVYREVGDAQKERAMLEDLAARKGDATEVYPRLLELARNERDWVGVRHIAQQMLAVNPLVPAPHRYLAEAAEQFSDAQQAIRGYHALMQLDPADPAEVHYRLGRNLHLVGRNDEAFRHVLTSLEEAPRFQDAHRLLLKLDAALRSPPPDSAPPDSAPPDSAPSDSAPSDSAPSDSAPSDSAPSDSAPSDAQLPAHRSGVTEARR
ncbi:MAG: tetratricopeptide repeat protein [Pirellulaceae bacterium]